MQAISDRWRQFYGEDGTHKPRAQSHIDAQYVQLALVLPNLTSRKTPSTFHTRTHKPIALNVGGGGYGGGTPEPLQEIISNFNLGRHGSPVASPVKNKLLLPVMELEVLSFKLVFWLSTQGEKSSGT